MNHVLKLATAPRDPSEHQIQSAFFRRLDASPWADFPIYSVPNESGAGGNSKLAQIRGARKKQSGRKRGVPDICVAVPRRGVPGLYIETKQPGKHPSRDQRDWLFRLAMMGYATAVCRSTDELWGCLTHYLTVGWEPDDNWQPGKHQPRWKSKLPTLAPSPRPGRSARG